MFHKRKATCGMWGEMSSNKTHLERFASIVPLPYYGSYLAVGAMLFLITFVIIMIFEKTNQHYAPFFILSILISFQCTVIFWAHLKFMQLTDVIVEMIDLPRDLTLKWFDQQEATMFNDKMMIIAGIAITVMAHIFQLDDFGFNFKLNILNFIIKFYYYLAHYIMGAGLYLLIATALVLYRMSRLPLDINILLSKNIRFKGTIYSKFTVCATITYLLWGIFHLTTPARLSAHTSMLWFSSFAMILIAYFVVPQYLIYRIITNTKEKKLNEFLLQMKKKSEEAFENQSLERLSNLNDMLDVRDRLDEFCAWPFGFYEILHIFLIIIIPLMVVIVELLH